MAKVGCDLLLLRGGGLLAGVAAYVKQVRPDVKVYGVEAEDAAGMTASLEAGKPVVLDHVGLICRRRRGQSHRPGDVQIVR